MSIYIPRSFARRVALPRYWQNLPRERLDGRRVLNGAWWPVLAVIEEETRRLEREILSGRLVARRKIGGWRVDGSWKATLQGTGCRCPPEMDFT